MIDAWGAPVAADRPETIDAWNDAWLDTLHFVGDPLARLTAATESDPSFALGSVFCAAYRLLGALPSVDPLVRHDLDRVDARSHSPREVGHRDALRLLAAGDFTAAGECWTELARSFRDLAAVRLAHDVYLHIGDGERRLQASEEASEQFGDGPGWGFVRSQLSFALGEMGRLDEAESAGWAALEEDPLDLWALHALAHVYETADDQPAALQLLEPREVTWSRQESLSVHIYWHLALRYIASGEHDRALALHDRLIDSATTPFRLGDMISLLWRLELAGADVGHRWDGLADAFAERPERHTSGFLDLHAALVYSRRPDHPVAAAFFAGVESSHQEDTSENGSVFRDVVRPLVEAVRHAVSDPARALQNFDAVTDTQHRIGGSNAQRDLLSLTRAAVVGRIESLHAHQSPDDLREDHS